MAAVAPLVPLSGHVVRLAAGAAGGAGREHNEGDGGVAVVSCSGWLGAGAGEHSRWS